MVSGCVETGRVIDRRDFDPFYAESDSDEVPYRTGGEETEDDVKNVSESEENVCERECGVCEEIDYSGCECLPVPLCCGNGICEYGEGSETCDSDCPEQSLLFSEIVYDSKSPENKKEWFEIYNPTGKGFDLTGFTVSDSDFSWEFPKGFILGPEEFITIARDSEGFYDEYGCEPVISGFSRTLNNDGDSLILSSDDGRVLDEVCWKGVNGWDIEAPEGKCIKRKDWDDNDLPEDWEGDRTATPWGCPVDCGYSERVCDDGFVSMCENLFIEDECQNCEPDCTGHEIPQCGEQWVCSEWGECADGKQSRTCSDMKKCGTEKGKPDETRECFSCGITCGKCQELNAESCYCYEIVPCDGNGICEVGEYGKSEDCMDCGDDDPCTSDYYNYSTGTCHYEPVCPCCGNGICEEGEDCLDDCNQEFQNLIFTEIGYDVPAPEYSKEWIEIYNPNNFSIELEGWKISDNSGSWDFPDDFSVEPESFILIARDGEGFSMMFNCTPDIESLTRNLNNDGDHLSLTDDEGSEIDFVSWEGGHNSTFPEWDIYGDDGYTIKRDGFTDNDSPSDWLANQEPDPSGC